MPASRISHKELEQLLTSIITPAGGDSLESLLRDCHESERIGPGASDERYFHKLLGYRDFDLCIFSIVISDETVQFAEIQFKRPSVFPAPYLNRNRRLVRELRALIDDHYEGQEINVVRDGQGRNIHYHYGARLAHVSSNDWLDCVGECTLIDEPHSSGQGSGGPKAIRNDFVIIRFNRDFAWRPAHLRPPSL